MKTNEETNYIVEQLITLIYTLRDGEIYNLDDILQKFGFSYDSWNEDGKRILHNLLDAARKHNIYLETDYIDSIDEDVPNSLGFTLYHNTPCFWYCCVGFEDFMTVYTYISDIGYIPACSYVAVPYGSPSKPVIGQVQSCGIYRDSIEPFISNQSKHVIRIATKKEYDAQPKLEFL